jgi:sulfate permease, SulP family
MLASLVPSRGDVFGGISAGIVALPLCLAFGAISGPIVNIEAGGKTRLSGVIHGLFLLAVLLGLSGLVSYIPNAVLRASLSARA